MEENNSIKPPLPRRQDRTKSGNIIDFNVHSPLVRPTSEEVYADRPWLLGRHASNDASRPPVAIAEKTHVKHVSRNEETAKTGVSRLSHC